MNLAKNFIENAEQYLNSPAITFNENTWLYEDLINMVRQWHTYFKDNVREGDNIVCLSENRPEIFAVYMATASLGGTFIPLHPESSTDEVEKYVKRCKPTNVVYSNTLSNKVTLLKTMDINFISVDIPFKDLEIISEMQFVHKDDHDVLIAFTSGSTGEPKGVITTHQSEIASYHSYAKTWGITSRDHILVSLPMSFVFSLAASCTTALLNGAHVILEEKFHPVKSLKNMDKYNISVFMGVPTMYQMMINVKNDNPDIDVNLSDMRLMLTAGAPTTSDIIRNFKNHFDVQIHEFYALSETRLIFSYIDGDNDSIIIGSCGKKVPGIKVKLMNNADESIEKSESVGEVAVKSNTLFKKYYRNQETTDSVFKEGWFYTGDLAKFDENGFYYIVGRKKEMIIRGGINIYPVEIEKGICQHPEVIEAAVIGLPDDVLGEELYASVVIDKGSEMLVDDLKHYLAAYLAEYKIPENIAFMSELPKGKNGKVSKKELEKWWIESRYQQSS